MGVAEQLGFDGDGGLLGEAQSLWTGWAAVAPPLSVVREPKELRGWLQGAEFVDSDLVLRELARLGSPAGGDSIAAAGVLAWVLLPGACSIAGRLATLTPRIDEMVAAQLWIEVRHFAWQRLSKVAANILDNTRTGVLRECGAASQLARSDRTWSQTVTADPHSSVWDVHGSRALAGAVNGPVSLSGESELTAAEELLELLDWACRVDVITEVDRSLLLSVLEAAERAHTRRFGRGRGGLMANDVSELVACSWGLSSITVRRRTRRAVRALTDACAAGRYAA